MSTHPQGPKPTRTGLSRRGFLKRSAVAAGAFGIPTIIPASALGADGTTAPSNRINIGCIGVGSQGTGNMRNFVRREGTQIVAVCDVDKAHRDNAKRLVDEAYGNSDCATYNDFRELLERDDLDAISLALPDHWHSIPVLLTARKKLHMYSEKPLALTISEGRAMVDAVNAAGVVWQTGSWQRSQKHFRRGCEFVRNGRIGEVHTVQVGLPTGSPCPPQPVMPVPEGFDYDFWLGPAPDAPYTEKRCHWDFRWILDYSGGQLSDWAGHHGDIANWGMGTEGTGPTRIKGVGNFPKEGLWNAATDYYIVAEYPKGASPVAPNGFRMLISNAFPMGTRFIGDKGQVYVNRGEVLEAFLYVPGQREVKDFSKDELAAGETTLYASDDHFQNFLDCVRKGDRNTAAPIDAAHYAINLAHLGNISMRLEKTLNWDPVKERFVNDPTADRMLSRSMRAPWHLA